jgi:hypothetical protein
MEYCRFGNLKSYLIKNRNKFIDQLNRLGDTAHGNKIGSIDRNEPDKYNKYKAYQTGRLIIIQIVKILVVILIQMI